MMNMGKHFDYEWCCYDNNRVVGTIKFEVRDDGSVNILDSYKVLSDETKLEFISALREQPFGVDFNNRSDWSILIEWKAHNILYKKGIFKKHTEDTCFNKKDRWYRRLGYRIVCFIFTEK